GRALDQLDAVGRLADHAGRLGVAVLADVDDVVAGGDQLARQVVRAGDVRAGRVHAGEAARARLVQYRRRDAMGGEDDGRPPGLSVQRGPPVLAIERDDPELVQLLEGVPIVDEQAQDVHRAAPFLDYLLGDRLRDLHRVDHTVAIAPRAYLDDFHA